MHRPPVRTSRAPNATVCITDAELSAILWESHDKLAVAIEPAYATVLRVSDILKLRWDDVAEGAAITQQKTGSRQRFVLDDNLRAKSATDADAQGMDATRLLGHADKRTTQTYLRGLKVTTVEPLRRRKM